MVSTLTKRNKPAHLEEIVGLRIHRQSAFEGRVVLKNVVDVIRERATLLRRVAKRVSRVTLAVRSYAWTAPPSPPRLTTDLACAMGKHK